ncbi:hypothetical protein [Cohnella silvisoli]|uniref:WD40 repeat domain-containing protein n=1 Tax=Cohnella silvisoli TaxID=2873699 RepID=A0ABV1KN08_9BACL|nr:hypothetical protein [Cohnella silvisoli]MCD9020193.1 hypothetical protein [Cohnella silvisoli]
MYRKLLIATLIVALTITMTSCGNEPVKPEAQAMAEPSLSATPSPIIVVSPAPEESVESEVSIETLLQRNFSKVLKLSMEEYHCESLVAVGTDEVILSARKYDPETTRIVRVNLRTGQSTVVWESSVELMSSYSLRKIGDAVGWDAYDAENSMNRRTYRLIGEQLVTNTGNGDVSPDGHWSVSYGTGNHGIWGVNQSTGKQKQWTSGTEDWQPLWLPDSSGFLFLHDTGEQIGDGAGPYYELARYDIASQKTSILPYDKAFWGSIEWLEPGVSLVANNGFDDVVGLKIVNLESGIERQIVDTSDYEYLRSVVEPISKQLFISDQGSFKFYGSDGEVKSEVAWPTGLDEYSGINTATPDSPDQPLHYYESEREGGRFGPSQFQFSPDGTRLAYLLGAIGVSSADVVEGTQIALADNDGKRTKLLTQDYMQISEYQWTPDGAHLVALISPPSDPMQAYLGVIDL